ncbi:hypothetical protein [Arthrobacter sp. MYb222]|uniref:hypothetical protein n=1 Tax=Arthrobacter sp. MYb222 TaxID=1848599 RepID=UPI000CFDB45E|nr:hypothetical protein [Arthrobacter sp. MYb222]PQZ86746.1 hypothetical protein CQ016_09780 [Arthrobacter sp. MYb222]
MSSGKKMSPEEQLAALGLAQQGMQRAAGYGAKLLGTYCIILGVLMGGLAALLQVFRPDADFIGFIVIMALFCVSVAAMSLAYGKLYRSLPRGHSKVYLRGFIASMVLYAVAVALLGAGPMGWGAIALIWIIVAAPLFLTGIAMVRK